MHPELAAMLAQWLKGMQPGEKLFPRLAHRKTHVMVKKDLERVGIAYETTKGSPISMPPAGIRYITELLRKGASLPEAKELARHSDIKTTMRYTHIGINDQARTGLAHGAEQRNCFDAKPSAIIQKKDAALHDALQFSAALRGHSLTLNGTEHGDQKRQNPRNCKGFDAVWQWMSRSCQNRGDRI